MEMMTVAILDIVNQNINSKAYKNDAIDNNDIPPKIKLNCTQLDDDLTKLGMDSIAFIHIIVAIENLFGIEIPDEKLLITELDTIRKMIDVVTVQKSTVVDM